METLHPQGRVILGREACPFLPHGWVYPCGPLRHLRILWVNRLYLSPPPPHTLPDPFSNKEKSLEALLTRWGWGGRTKSLPSSVRKRGSLNYPAQDSHTFLHLTLTRALDSKDFLGVLLYKSRTWVLDTGGAGSECPGALCPMQREASTGLDLRPGASRQMFAEGERS